MSEPLTNSKHELAHAGGGALDVAIEAAQRGAADARDAANRTWTATERFVSRCLYTACYTVSYGVVFPSVLLARSIPVNNAAVRGLIDGANAARLKVDEIYQSQQELPSPASVAALAPV
jgi:hypothetical protein